MDSRHCGGQDLTQASKATRFSRHIEAALNVSLNTGGGRVDTDQTLACSMNLNGFIAKIRAYLMKNSPSVVSVGKRVCTYGFAFVWFPGLSPGLITPNGMVIALHEYKNMPYISARTVLDAMRYRALAS